MAIEPVTICRYKELAPTPARTITVHMLFSKSGALHLAAESWYINAVLKHCV